MKAEAFKGTLLLTLVMAAILVLATSGAKDIITIAVPSQADDDISDSTDHMLVASLETWIALPTDDAGVSRGFPDNKRGVEEPWHMWVSSCLGVPHEGYFLTERSFLKFNLSTIPSLENSCVRLYVYCYKIDGAPNGDIECCYVNNDNWSENEITWNTQPALGDVIDNCTITEAKRWYCWDVTSFVENEFADDNTASFCLKTVMEYNEYPNYYFYGWRTKEFWENWACPYLIIGRNAGIQVSTDYREGLAGGTLNYDVNVINKGSLPDNYSLTVTDDAGWAMMLSENSLESVQPGEKMTVTLNIIIPENAELCAEDNILATVTSRSDSGVSEISSCIAHVSKKIKPPCEDLAVVTGDPTIGDWSGFWVGRYHNNPEHGWLKFDLRAIPANFDIHSVRLYLYCWNVNDSANVQVHRADNDEWMENETNCWNEPSFGAVISSSQLIDSVGWYSWDVTSYVQSEFMSDKIISFCLVDLGEDTPPDHAASFESKEWSDTNIWPYLEVSGDLIPPTESPTPNEVNWPLIAGIAGVIVIIGIVAALYMRRH